MEQQSASSGAIRAPFRVQNYCQLRRRMESKRKRDILFCRKVLILKAGGVGRWRPFSVAVGSYVNLVPGVAQGFKTQIAEIGGRCAAETREKGRFRVGKSEFVLGPASCGESFRVGVIGFDPSAAASKLGNLGVNAAVARDKSAVSFRDPDGIKVEIGA